MRPFVILALWSFLPIAAQTDTQSGTQSAQSTSSTPASDASQDPTTKITAGLAKQSNADFELQIGIASLVRNGQVSDYVDNSNVISSTSLGNTTPQYLLGVSLRSPMPNFPFAAPRYDCSLHQKSDSNQQKPGGTKKTTTVETVTTDESGRIVTTTNQTTVETKTKVENASNPAPPGAAGNTQDCATKCGKNCNEKCGKNCAQNCEKECTEKCKKVPKELPAIPPSMSFEDACPVWRRRPWSGFVSLKFAPNASNTLNGYTFGVSYGIARYLNLLAGIALTPVNEPSHGLRNAAALYVSNQQKLGNLLQFNPVAMQNNQYNAFDGFSLLDTNGKLIFTGTPLETHYYVGAVLGVAIPLSFNGFLSTGK